MVYEEIKNKVRTIFIENFFYDNFDNDTNMFGLVPVPYIVNVVLELEKVFQIEINDDNINAYKYFSVNNLTSHLENYIK